MNKYSPGHFMNNSIPHTQPAGRRPPPPFGIRKSLSPWMYHPGGENQRSIDFSNLFFVPCPVGNGVRKVDLSIPTPLPPFSPVRDRKKSCQAPGVYVQYYYGWICLFFCTGKMEESPPPPFCRHKRQKRQKRQKKRRKGTVSKEAAENFPHFLLLFSRFSYKSPNRRLLKRGREKRGGAKKSEKSSVWR